MYKGAAGMGSFLIISFCLLIPPFLWHIRSRNLPATILIFWLMYVDLTGFISTMIWSGDNFDEAWDGQVYCDIVGKLDAGSSVGKCCAIACVIMNLYFVLCAKHPTLLEQGSWKKFAMDMAICLINPIFVMAVHYIVTGSRYAIVKYQGCSTIYSATYASLLLVSIWTVLWSIVALIFAVLTLITFFRKRKDVKDILLCTNSGLNIKRFARLLIFSFLIVFAMIPLSLYYFVSQAEVLKNPFHWDQVHNEEWNVIYFYDFGFFTFYDRLVNCILSVLAFIIFGLGSDALDMYKSMFHKVHNRCWYKKTDEPYSQEQAIKSMEPQTKINSNKSQFSNTTSFTNTSTMRDIENQFGDVMHQIISEENTSFRFEKQLQSSPATLVKEDGVPRELQSIIKDTDSSSDQIFYKYQVKLKSYDN